MRLFRILAILSILALTLAVFPVRVGAQDQTSKPYTVIVGHVVILGWDASTTPGVSYNIYVSGVSGGPYTKIGSTSALTFQDLNATAGNTYFYVVTAFNSNGESAYSNQVSVTIPTP